jgi:hypothetical protein
VFFWQPAADGKFDSVTQADVLGLVMAGKGVRYENQIGVEVFAVSCLVAVSLCG